MEGSVPILFMCRWRAAAELRKIHFAEVRVKYFSAAFLCGKWLSGKWLRGVVLLTLFLWQ
jgi:hypothetical protein